MGPREEESKDIALKYRNDGSRVESTAESLQTTVARAPYCLNAMLVDNRLAKYSSNRYGDGDPSCKLPMSIL